VNEVFMGKVREKLEGEARNLPVVTWNCRLYAGARMRRWYCSRASCALQVICVTAIIYPYYTQAQETNTHG